MKTITFIIVLTTLLCLLGTSNAAESRPCEFGSRLVDGKCQRFCAFGTFLVNDKCQKVACKTKEQCSPYTSYCNSIKNDGPQCKPDGYCECVSRQKVGTVSVKSCSLLQNGDDDCPKGQVCGESNLCIKDPNCHRFGRTCIPGGEKKCCGGTYCLARSGSSSYTCVKTAFVRESCVGNVPCEEDSECINGKCSLRYGDSCDPPGSVCPSKTECRHVPINTGVNKMCL